MQQYVGSSLCNQSVSLCLFIGALSPLILGGIMFFVASFWFVKGRLFSFFFYGVVSLLVLTLSIYYPLKGWIHGKILCEFGFVMEYFGFSIYGN